MPLFYFLLYPSAIEKFKANPKASISGVNLEKEAALDPLISAPENSQVAGDYKNILLTGNVMMS